MTIYGSRIAAILTSIFLITIVTNTQAATWQTAHKNIIYPEKLKRHSGVEPVIKESSVDIRVVRNFRKNFPDVTGVKWKLSENHYFATFTNEAVRHKIVYRQNGGMDYHLKMYKEAQLPNDIRKAIRSVYIDYAISTAQELRLNNRTIFLIQLSGRNEWKTIRMCDGNMEEIQYLEEGPLE